MRRPVFHAVLFLVIVAAAGCASPRSNFYTLSPSVKPPAASGGYGVAVGPVSVPEALDRPQIVLRTGPHQVFIDEINRWASPLRDEIARGVAGNLASALGTGQVSVSHGAAASGARYRVAIDVMSFESALGQSTALDAMWNVRSVMDGSTRAGRTTASEPVGEKGYPALVAAHGRALEKLAGDIAGAIRALEGKAK